mgnify:CR=1 FL=1
MIRALAIAKVMNSRYPNAGEPLTVSIRRAQSADDLDEVLRLQRACLPYDTPASVELGYWWLARDAAGFPVGFAGLYHSLQWSDTGYLCRAGVAHLARGRGLQRRLIAVRERFARSVGFVWLVSDTCSNPASANSLIRCGYRMFEPSKPWGAKGACHWKKRITQ